MKKTYIKTWVIAAAMGIMAVGCSEDKGNYDYKSLETITISGIEEGYTKLSAAERITIDPTVTCSDPNAEFEYFWAISPVKPNNIATPIEEVETICDTKAIDYLVSQQAGAWKLVFCAKNKKSGYTQYASSNIDVTTAFSRGWFVLKDDGSQADIDMYTTKENTSSVMDKRMDNVYSTVNGRKLDGKGLLFQFHDGFRTFVSGNAIAEDTRVLTAISEADASVVYMNTFKEILGFNEMFVSAPGVKAPGSISTTSQIISMVNDGQVHCGVFAMTGPTRFGTIRLKNAAGTPYRMSKYFLTGYPSEAFFFDEMTSSFFFSQGSTNYLVSVKDAATTQISASNNGQTLLYMGYLNSAQVPPFGSNMTGYAIFQDKSDATKKTLSKIMINHTNRPILGATMNISSTPLTTADKLYNGSCFAMPNNATTTLEAMYFAVNKNEIWTRDMINKTEKQQFVLPAGEEITFIRHRVYNPDNATEKLYAYDYIMVGSKSGSNYKVRMFTRATPSTIDINTTPAFVLEGTGMPRDVIYISSMGGSAAMSKSTYPNTY